MINILKLRKLQKEKATAGSKPAEAENTQTEARPAEAEVQADTAGSAQGKKAKKSRKVQTAAENSAVEVGMETALVTDTEPATVEVIADEPVTVEEIKPVTSSEAEDISALPETVKEDEDAVSAEDLDRAELLRQQLINELMNDQNYNQPPAGEEDQNAEREMLMMLMEESRKKRETSDSSETAAAEDTEESGYKDETENIEEVEEPSEAVPAAEETKNESGPDEQVLTQPEVQYVPAATNEPVQESNPTVSAEQVQSKEPSKGIQEVIQLVSFELGRELYGVDIIKIREINRMTGITKVPRAPEFIEGVINLRGSVIPVINLRTKVKMPRKEYDKDTRIIVMDLRGFVVGFIVDAVREVLRIPENLVVPPPDLAVGKRAEYITAVAKLSDKLVILMEPERILSAEENRQLQKS
ncbi:MAG: chemotaxis protein CheW [Bacteroidota bacterium]